MCKDEVNGDVTEELLRLASRHAKIVRYALGNVAWSRQLEKGAQTRVHHVVQEDADSKAHRGHIAEQAMVTGKEEKADNKWNIVNDKLHVANYRVWRTVVKYNVG